MIGPLCRIAAAIALPLSLAGCSGFDGRTYEEGVRDGVAEAKAYIRMEICYRQQFADRSALAAASDAESDAAVKRCMEQPGSEMVAPTFSRHLEDSRPGHGARQLAGHTGGRRSFR